MGTPSLSPTGQGCASFKSTRRKVGGGECYSQAARKALLRLTPVGSTVLLEADPQLDNGGIAMLVGCFATSNVTGSTSTSVLYSTEEGLYFYRSERGRYAERFVSAVTQAKTAQGGLWGACPRTQLTMTGPLQTQQGKPTPTTPPLPIANPGSPNCHPSYKGACLDPNSSDYDCAGGSGAWGPLYTGRVEVVGPDDFGLDRDGDGVGCD